MTRRELEALMMRIDILETQQAVLAGLVATLLQFQSIHSPDIDRPSLRAMYEEIFEKAISNLLASNLGFSDAAVQSIENLKKLMLKTLP